MHLFILNVAVTQSSLSNTVTWKIRWNVENDFSTLILTQWLIIDTFNLAGKQCLTTRLTCFTAANFTSPLWTTPSSDICRSHPNRPSGNTPRGRSSREFPRALLWRSPRCTHCKPLIAAPVCFCGNCRNTAGRFPRGTAPVLGRRSRRSGSSPCGTCFPAHWWPAADKYDVRSTVYCLWITPTKSKWESENVLVKKNDAAAKTCSYQTRTKPEKTKDKNGIRECEIRNRCVKCFKLLQNLRKMI